jgi:hypothetical protein
MLKDITVIDFQGKERRAQARYTEVNTQELTNQQEFKVPKLNIFW